MRRNVDPDAGKALAPSAARPRIAVQDGEGATAGLGQFDRNDQAGESTPDDADSWPVIYALVADLVTLSIDH
jgi:hypothetical protein